MEMSTIQMLAKICRIFTGSKKEKEKKKIGSAPKISKVLSSSQQQEKCDVDDDEKEEIKECNADNLTGTDGQIKTGRKDETKLFVGCLALSTTSKELEDYFSRFGQVIHANVVRHPKGGQSRGYGFVTFADPESYKAALDKKDHVLEGKAINPQPHKPKPNERSFENRIYLGNLSNEFTEKDVEQFFSAFGEIEYINVPLDKETRKSKGFGFVSFKDKFVFEKLITEGFVYMNRRRVVIKKAVPFDFDNGNDKLSIGSSSNTNAFGLESFKSFCDIRTSDDDASSVVPGESQPITELVLGFKKLYESYFLTKFSNFNSMNEKKTTNDSSSKDDSGEDDVGKMEKLLADFLMNSNEQKGNFGENLIEFSDDESCSSSSDAEEGEGEEKEITDEEEDDADDDIGVSNAKNFDRSYQEQSAQFSKILENRSRFCTKMSDSKSSSSNPDTREFTTCQKSSMPLKIKNEEGSFVCSLCQWMSPVNSCETFLAHCRTTSHRAKLKERFLTEQSQKGGGGRGAPKTGFTQDSKRSQEICFKPKAIPEKPKTQGVKCFREKQNGNEKNQKFKDKKPTCQAQSKHSPETVNVSIEKTESRKVEKKKTENNKKKNGEQSEGSNATKKVKALNISALARSMAWIQPLSENEVICKMCKKFIPKALDPNNLMKNITYHIQSKRHLNKVFEVENSAKNEPAKKIEGKNTGEKKIPPSSALPKVNATRQKAPSLKKKTKKIKKNFQEVENPARKTVKSSPCLNTIDLNTNYLCLTCNSYFSYSEVFKAHMNSEIHLNCLGGKNKKSASASSVLHKCFHCQKWLGGSLGDINEHITKCAKRKN